MKYRFGREKIKVLCTASTRFRRVLYSHAEPSEIFFFFFFFKTEKRERPKTPLPLDPNILWLSFFSLLDLLLEKKAAAAATTSARAFGRLIHPCPALSLSFFSLSFIYIYISYPPNRQRSLWRGASCRDIFTVPSLSLSLFNAPVFSFELKRASFIFLHTRHTIHVGTLRCCYSKRREEKRRKEECPHHLSRKQQRPGSGSQFAKRFKWKMNRVSVSESPKRSCLRSNVLPLFRLSIYISDNVGHSSLDLPVDSCKWRGQITSGD